MTLRVDPVSQLTHSFKHGHAPKHGKRHPLYTVWKGMRERCRYPKNAQYCNYGGKGISVCEEWHDFAVFLAWAEANGWRKGLQIDRIDNNGNYCPSNCRLATPLQQGENRTDNHILTAWGESKPISAWSRDPRCVVCYSALLGRILKGWDAEKAMSTPSGVRLFLVSAFGDTKSASQWEKDSRCLVSRKTLTARIRSGWSAEDAMTAPNFSSRKKSSSTHHSPSQQSI